MFALERGRRGRFVRMFLALAFTAGAVGCGGGAADVPPTGGDVADGVAADGVGADVPYVQDAGDAGDAEGPGEDGAVADLSGADGVGVDGPGEDAAVEDAAVEDVAVEDAAVEDVAVEDGVSPDVAVEDVAVEDVAVEDGVSPDVVTVDVAVDVAGDDVADDVGAGCDDECPGDGAQQCADDGATQTCGQHDADPCFEWSAPEACAAGSSCVAGACTTDEPEAVLVNEVSYDAEGGDGAAGTTVFVELWGPPGLSLDGYRVVAVNGNGGATYETIPLDGHAIGDDGYFVIAHPDGAAAVVAVADLLDAAADLQNGPDSVQVRFGDDVLDALGYGSFAAGDVFAGEGLPAPGAGPGESLSRDPDHTDTDDNAGDFAVGTPTPGAAGAGCADECDAAGLTTCDGDGAIRSCVVDADGDPCLEWGPAADCPAGESCVGVACAPPACADECTTEGGEQCVAGVVRTCGDHDADDCLEWGDDTPCALGWECDPAGETCVTPALANYRWNVHAGGTNSDWAIGAAVTPEGDALVGGIFQGPFFLGAEELTYDNTDIFLTRVSSTGEVVWARDIGGWSGDHLRDLARAPNGDVVFVGWYDGETTIGETTLSNANSSWDAFVARYTEDGDPVWARKFAGDGDNEANGVAVAPTGDIYVGGVYEESFALSGVYGLFGNAYVAKLDADGDVSWSFGIGGPEYDGANAVAVAEDGGVIVTGSVGSRVDFDPGAEEREDGPGLFVARYGPAGDYRWHLVRSNAAGNAVAVDARGDVYVVGAFTSTLRLAHETHAFAGGSTDGFLLKVSRAGAAMWSSQLGSIGADRLADVVVDPTGNVLVTGHFGSATTWEGVALAHAGGPTNYEEDVVLAEFTPDGALNWVDRFGGPGEDQGHTVAAAPSGDVVWGGHFSETMTLDDDTLESQGYGDLAIARFAGTADGSPGCFTEPPVCAAHGACREVGETPTCFCEDGWGGPNCADCATGFTADGGGCVSVCDGVACDAAERCVVEDGAAACVCAIGWAGADCDACAPGYAVVDGCLGPDCDCLPFCGPGAPAGNCADCAGAVELTPGAGSVAGWVVTDGDDALGGCGGYGPDHALVFTVADPTHVELTLVTPYPVLYLRRTCDDPTTEIACATSTSGPLVSLAEDLEPGTYTIWIDTQDGTGSSYTLNYVFETLP